MSGTAAAETYAPPVPRAVRAASKRADELHQQSGEPGKPTTVVEPYTPPANEPAAAAPAAPPAPQPPAPAAPPAQDWEARYNTLQGKYNREIPGFQQQISQLQGQIQGLQQILAARTSAEAHAPAAPAAPNADLDADRAEYGELVDKAQRWAEAQFTPTIAQLRQEIAELRGQTQNTVQTSNRSRVEQALDAWASRTGRNWQDQNNDPQFIAWLAHVDPFFGEPRQAAMNRAVQAGDATRIVALFNAFADETAAITGQQPSQGQPRVPATPAAPTQGKVPLETLAAPGRGGGAGGSQAPRDKRMWTSSEVKTFYEQLKRGKWRGREAEAHALEQDIIAAPAEGRYRQ